MTDLAMITVSANWTAMVKPSSSLPLAANHARFSELVEQTLAYARQIGASDAAAEVSESLGLSVSVRKNDIETVEQTRDRSLDLTVYAGQSRGSASTSDFSEAALRQTVEAAWHIARHTAADPAAGLPDADQLATEFPDLDLHHAWPVSTEEAAELALRAERRPRGRFPHHQYRWRLGGHLRRPVRHGQYPWLPGWLRLFAPQPVGGADRRPRQRHAARLLVHVRARSGPPGLARGRGSLCRRAHAVAPVGAAFAPASSRCCSRRHWPWAWSAP